MHKRGSGVLLHIVSLPSPYGIGDLGPSAFQFADFLSQSRQCFWQVLPLNPTGPEHDFSPYSSFSTHALNPLLISPDVLYEEGYIQKSDLVTFTDINPHKVSYKKAFQYKNKLLKQAFSISYNRGLNSEFELFCHQHQKWLDEHALFVALSSKFADTPWNSWPVEIRERDHSALKNFSDSLKLDILQEKFIQFLLSHQWIRLKRYCHEKGVQLIGDLPMFVSFDSVDVWANKQNFKINSQNQTAFFAGAPPDRFNQSGQVWHTPVYNWDIMKSHNYDWWITRFSRSFELFDILRIDHFRGFVAYWEISADHADATRGYWQSVPVEHFFNTLFKHFFCFPVIAEDLGTITSDVRETMIRLNLPGTKVLLFAFENDDPDHPYLPHNYSKNCMACTGTHDTNTIKGWFEDDASERERERLFRYIGEKVSSETVNWKSIQIQMVSAADMVIFPLQDIIGQGSSCRMNIPGARKDNWQYRFTYNQVTQTMIERLGEMTVIYGRT